jgi:hypothetical protein
MKKLEIITPKLHLETLVKILEETKVISFMVLNMIDAKIPGEGRIYDSGIVIAQDKSYVIVLIDDEDLQNFSSNINSFRDKFNLLILVSESKFL